MIQTGLQINICSKVVVQRPRIHLLLVHNIVSNRVSNRDYELVPVHPTQNHVLLPAGHTDTQWNLRRPRLRQGLGRVPPDPQDLVVSVLDLHCSMESTLSSSVHKHNSTIWCSDVRTTVKASHVTA